MPDIFGDLVRKWDHAEHAAREEAGSWFRREHPYASQTPDASPVNLQAAAAAQPKENPLSFITDVKNDLATAAHDVAAKAADFEQNVLPAAASKLTALEGNPVVDALLNAVHVPPEGLDVVVGVINKLEGLYNPATATPAAPAPPADPAPPAPVA